MRRPFLMFALMLAAAMSCRLCRAAEDLTTVQRARIVFDLLLDGDVTTPASYAGVDLASPTLAVDWIDALIYAHRPQYKDRLVPGSENELTSPQKGQLMFNIFRSIFRQAKETRDASLAADAARAAELATIAGQATTDLGAEEVVEEP